MKIRTALPNTAVVKPVISRKIPLAGILVDLLSLPLLYVVLPPYLIGSQLSHSSDIRVLWMGVMALWLLVVWGSMINHYADWQADITNQKRMLLHDSWQRSDLLRYQLIPLILFLLVSLLASWQVHSLFIVFILGLFSALQYSALLRFKDRLYFSYVYLAFAYGSYPLLLGFLMGDTTQAVANWIPALCIFLFLLFVDIAIAPVKDLEDIPGDRRIGKHTLPVILGVHKTYCFQSSVILLAVIFAIALVFVTHIPLFWFLIPLCLGLIVLLRFSASRSIQYATVRNAAVILSITIRMSLVLGFIIFLR